MTQNVACQSRVMAALSEDLSLVLRLYIGHLVATCHSNFRGSDTLFSPLQGLHTCHTCVCIHTQINVKLSLENKTTIWYTTTLPLIEDEIKFPHYRDICVYFYLKNELFPEYLILQDIGHLHRLSHVFIL